MSDIGHEQPVPSQSDIVSQPPPEQVFAKEYKPVHPLALRLTQIQNNTKEHIQLLNLYSIEQHDETSEVDGTPIARMSFDEINNKSVKLLESQKLSPTEQLLQAAHLLREHKRSFTTSHDFVRDQVAEHYKELEEIREQLRDKNAPTRFSKRFFDAYQKGVLQVKEKEIEKRISDKIEKATRYVENYKRNIDHVYTLHEKLLMTETTELLKKLVNDYEGFTIDLHKDPILMGEIQNDFIEKEIASQLQASYSGVLEPEEIVNYSQFLKTLLQERTMREKNLEDELSIKKTLREKLLTYRNEHPNLYGGPSEKGQSLIDGGDKDIVTHLVGRMVHNDVTHVIAQSSQLRQDVNIEDYINNYLSRSDDIFGTTSQLRYIYRKLSSGQGYDSFPMDFWQTLTSSPVAMEIFGDNLQQEYNAVYKIILDKSLQDTQGQYIDMLAYYPNPDTIRNLVLIAAADYKNYRTAHSNWVLNSLAQKADWEKILDDTIEAYPEMASAKEYLLHWNYSVGFGSNPGVQTACQDFVYSMYQNQKDPLLKQMAVEGLPNGVFLRHSFERGLIAQDDYQSFKDADEVFKEIETRRNELFALGTPYEEIPPSINRSLYDLALRNILTRNNDLKIRNRDLKRFAQYSQEIVKAKNDLSALNYLITENTINNVRNTNVPLPLLAAIPIKARLLMDDGMRETSAFIFDRSDDILHDEGDLEFIGKVLGEFGKRSDPLIRGYQECIHVGVIDRANRDIVIEFAKHFKAVTPTLIEEYKKAKDTHQEQVFVAHLRSLAERMTGSAPISDEERKDPIYKDLMQHVYAQNSGNWTSYEKNETCEDRSIDLEGFHIRPRYEMDLLSQSVIRVKEGKELDRQAIEDVQAPILAVSEKMKEMEFDYDKIKEKLAEEIDTNLQQIVEAGGLETRDIDALTTQEEKLFMLLTDSIYGSRSLDAAKVKELLITYEFANFEDISDYIQGTMDRVSRAGNQDYALLCEVGTFYSDRIKEVNRRLVESAWQNPQIAAKMPEYFRKLSQEASSDKRKEQINKLQIPKLGLTDGFIKQIGKILERRGRSYTPDQIRELIAKYEHVAGGLTAAKSMSTDKNTQAFYGQLRTQRERSFEAARQLAGVDIDPHLTHLGELDLQSMLNIEKQIAEGSYDENQFSSYTVQKFIDLFDSERTQVQEELDKFESESGKEREVLYGYITKSKESAHARMVGGVCVSGDNPNLYQSKNMWDMPNYFQLVLQDPETLACQGAVLLHHFTQGGKKILTASINPSSTYLYSIDEQALFGSLVGTLQTFAQDNEFDMIAISQNHTIRTNRTGGQFEQAIESKIAEVGKTFEFDEPQQFSYTPDYRLQKMDVVWEKGEDEVPKPLNYTPLPKGAP